jgi:hypothetical protein
LLESALKLLREYKPGLSEDSAVFLELKTLFSGNAIPPPGLADLKNFLGEKRLFRVIRVSGKTFQDVAYQLVDRFPEFSSAAGMFRSYKTAAGFYWTDIEAAEKVIADALVFDAYGWNPDTFSVIASENFSGCHLSAILAF